MKKKSLITLCVAVGIGCMSSCLSPVTQATASASTFTNVLTFLGLKKEAPVFGGVVTTSSFNTPDTNTLNIEWGAVEGASGYELTISHNTETQTFDTTTPAYSVTGVAPAAVYMYQIRCYQLVDGNKVYGEASTVFNAVTAISEVTGLKMVNQLADTDSSMVNLTWDAQGEATYQIYYKTASEEEYTLGGTTTANTFTLDGLQQGVNYQICVRAYALSENYAGDFSDDISVTAIPYMVSGLTNTKASTNQLDLSWTDSGTSSYRVYRSVNGGEYAFYKAVSGAAISDTELTPGTVYSYKVSAVFDSLNLEGPQSEELRCVTNPNKASGLKVGGFAAASVTLNWTAEPSASGYVIYRKTSSTSFTKVGITTELTYTDTSVAAGTSYFYCIAAYADSEAHIGEQSGQVKVSTLPAQPVVTPKAGEGKLRLKWTAVTGASGYYVYQLQEDGSYTQIDTLKGKTATSIEYKELTNDTIYSYKIYAYRNISTLVLDSMTPDVVTTTVLVSEDPKSIDVTPALQAKTSTTAYKYSTKAKLLKSKGWKVANQKKAAVYTKSYIIPGLKNTNVAGYTSTNMCPQAMCFAGSYMLITAYDRDLEERSVIYVLAKSTKKLQTVIVLDNNTHAGGICYDGTYVWVTSGSKLCSLPFSEIKKAAKAKSRYAEVSFLSSVAMDTKVSFATYYKKKIWAGSYESDEAGQLCGYKITKDSEGKPTLDSACELTIPSRVQGIVFTKKGRLIFSRAYSYTHQLDVYKPKKIGTFNMTLGSRESYIPMPSLNQGIDIVGNYLYVNFESAVSPQAENFMDRVVAFNMRKLKLK